jgi:hypothetical protein
MFWQQMVNSINLGAMYSLLAIGLSSIGPDHPAVMGALGENQFDENGDMVRDMLMYVVKDGVAVFYNPN